MNHSIHSDRQDWASPVKCPGEFPEDIGFVREGQLNRRRVKAAVHNFAVFPPPDNRHSEKDRPIKAAIPQKGSQNQSIVNTLIRLKKEKNL